MYVRTTIWKKKPITLYWMQVPEIFFYETILANDQFMLVVAKEHHYNDVTMSAMACLITSLTIVYSTVYSGADKKKTIKAPRHWSLFWEFSGDQWIHHTKGQ